MNKPDFDFKAFPKIPRFSREVIITEKIDGTNAQVYITADADIFAGSRNRWLDSTSSGDNYGFAKWVEGNKEDLLKLGPGHHFGEWWGQGIQRGYDLKEKRFSLFNVSLWNEETKPDCCYVVPVIEQGILGQGNTVHKAMMKIAQDGSFAAPGYKNPEGIIIYHDAAKQYFKKLIENDESHKG